MNHITLETARRLKEVGWERETHFVWALPWHIERPNACKDSSWFHCCPEGQSSYGDADYSHPIAAPLAEELLEVLPKYIQEKEWELYLHYPCDDTACAYYAKHCESPELTKESENGAAEALALLLIELVEQGVVNRESLSSKK